MPFCHLSFSYNMYFIALNKWAVWLNHIFVIPVDLFSFAECALICDGIVSFMLIDCRLLDSSQYISTTNINSHISPMCENERSRNYYCFKNEFNLSRDGIMKVWIPFAFDDWNAFSHQMRVNQRHTFRFVFIVFEIGILQRLFVYSSQRDNVSFVYQLNSIELRVQLFHSYK